MNAGQIDRATNQNVGWLQAISQNLGLGQIGQATQSVGCLGCAAPWLRTINDRLTAENAQLKAEIRRLTPASDLIDYDMSG